MYVKKGSDRIVFTFPKQGFVVKVARIKVFSAVYFLFLELFQRNWKSLRMRLRHPMRMPHSIPGAVLRGLSANWKEFTFYTKTRDEILQPTYFSFFGFFNIAKYDDPCGKESDPYRQLNKILGIDALARDQHHFGNPKNFCIVQGKLKMLDYGSKETQVILKKYSKKISAEFRI